MKAVKNKKKCAEGAEIFLNQDHYDIPDNLVFSDFRLDSNSPLVRGPTQFHDDVYKIPKNLVKTGHDDSILSAPIPARRDLDDYELPSRKKGSSMTKVAR